MNCGRELYVHDQVPPWSYMTDQALFHPPAYATAVNTKFPYLEETRLSEALIINARNVPVVAKTSPLFQLRTILVPI